IAAPCRTLDTDGFGRSDTRAQLRDFFEAGADWIVLHALDLLAERDPRLDPARPAARGRLAAGERRMPPRLRLAARRRRGHGPGARAGLAAGARRMPRWLR